MRKKLAYIIISLLIPIMFSGCSFKIGSYTFNNFTVTKKKPNNFYYTNSLSKNLSQESNIKISLLDTNFFKEKSLSKDDVDTVKSFAKSLKKTNFIEKPKDLPEKPAYRLYFSFSKEKYVINIYNEKYIAVYPWDGTYSMDYVDMSSVKPLNNLYGLCKYLIPR